ncbi:cupin domain-containing protein [Cellulosimicrobium terreum]|nr:cupin domain-containing protein [Cellulosimicrobium terreum]
MRIYRLPAHPLTHFGSADVEMVPVGRARGPAVVHVARIDAGGTIGEHPATVDQVLTVVSGRARVVGEDGADAELDAGDAVLWVAGEVHQTWALTDVVATILETGGGIEVAGAEA